MKYYIANWKMNMNESDIDNWTGSFKPNPPSEKIIIIAPSLPYLVKIKGAGFRTCAQDVSTFNKGAHTGETGSFQLKDFCEYCLIGHSERKEGLDTVIQKRDICLDEGITPVVCFVNIEDADYLYKPGVILAWEDPENISVNGKYAPKNTAEIRTNINILKASLPDGTEVIYGGSVNRQNIAELANINGLDGVLVGNASLDPAHFYEICRH